MKIKASVFVFIYSLIIVNMSRSLNLVSNLNSVSDPSLNYGRPDNFLEAIGFAIDVVIENISIFLQFMTLQTDLPILINTFVVAPIYIVTMMIVVMMIRGN